MSVTGADRVFAAALVVAERYRTFTATEIEAVTSEMHGDEAPSRRTIYSHLDGLVELGVLKEFGADRTMRRFRFIDRFDPS